MRRPLIVKSRFNRKLLSSAASLSPIRNLLVESSGPKEVSRKLRELQAVAVHVLFLLREVSDEIATLFFFFLCPSVCLHVYSEIVLFYHGREITGVRDGVAGCDEIFSI